jgi:hypothetical protein
MIFRQLPTGFLHLFLPDRESSRRPAAGGVSWLIVPHRTWRQHASERDDLVTGTVGISSTHWPAGRTSRACSRNPSGGHEHGRDHRHQESTWTIS